MSGESPENSFDAPVPAPPDARRTYSAAHLSLIIGVAGFIASLIPIIFYRVTIADARNWSYEKNWESRYRIDSRHVGTSLRDPERSGELAAFMKARRNLAVARWRTTSLVLGFLGMVVGVYGLAFTTNSKIAGIGFIFSLLALIWYYVLLVTVVIVGLLVLDLVFGFGLLALVTVFWR